jgi:glycosyltransferase involved in cell wall biosynthesis
MPESRNAPLVSAVVPVYNGERLIARSLASAAAQTYSNLEIIVIDDGSTDGSAAVVETAAAADNRIRFFQQPNSGVSASRNFGVAQAKGEFIAPLDADDLWHPEKISRQVAAMQASPSIGLAYCWAVEIDDADYVLPPVRPGSSAKGNVLAEMTAKAGIIPSGANPLIRRSFFEAAGGYDTALRHAEDWKLYLALALTSDFAVVPAHLVGYRRSHGSASRNVAAMAAGMNAVSAWIMEKWPAMPETIKRQMIFHRNEYLAHLALTDDQFAEALKYRLAGYAAWPGALLKPTSLAFAARFVARLAGIKKADWPAQSYRVRFGDFPSSDASP